MRAGDIIVQLRDSQQEAFMRALEKTSRARRLQNEVDALVARLYGLRAEDLEHILFVSYTFLLVNREVKEG